jgi:hypothetical protein
VFCNRLLDQYEQELACRLENIPTGLEDNRGELLPEENIRFGFALAVDERRKGRQKACCAVLYGWPLTIVFGLFLFNVLILIYFYFIFSLSFFFAIVLPPPKASMGQ